jgi:hypothetical protein
LTTCVFGGPRQLSSYAANVDIPTVHELPAAPCLNGCNPGAVGFSTPPKAVNSRFAPWRYTPTLWLFGVDWPHPDRLAKPCGWRDSERRATCCPSGETFDVQTLDWASRSRTFCRLAISAREHRVDGDQCSRTFCRLAISAREHRVDGARWGPDVHERANRRTEVCAGRVSAKRGAPQAHSGKHRCPLRHLPWERFRRENGILIAAWPRIYLGCRASSVIFRTEKNEGPRSCGQRPSSQPYCCSSAPYGISLRGFTMRRGRGRLMYYVAALGFWAAAFHASVVTHTAARLRYATRRCGSPCRACMPSRACVPSLCVLYEEPSAATRSGRWFGARLLVQLRVPGSPRAAR